MSYAIRKDGRGWRAVGGLDEVGPDETYSETQPELPLSAWSPDPIKAQVRAAREVVLNRLTGLRIDAEDRGDTDTVDACKAARISLLNITSDSRVDSATNDDEIKVAFKAAYGEIVAAAGEGLVKAFAGFNL